MDRSQALARFAAGICAASTVACTGGYITQQDGSQWVPTGPAGGAAKAGVVTIANGSSTNEVWADVGGNDTIFSFDPGATRQYDGNFVINSNVEIADGTYTFTVADTRVWQAQDVTVKNGGVCPYGDYWNGESTYCQLFQLELLDC